MKKLFFSVLTLLLAGGFLWGCSTYDDSALTDRVDDLEDRVARLEQLCTEMNANIKALQSLVSVSGGGDYITSVVPVEEGGKQIGYRINFAKGDPITIYHGRDGEDGADGAPGQDGVDGEDGQDGVTPVIGVRKDSDGIYYWTLNGEWLLDDQGQKIRAQGQDGAPGQDGQDGAPGQDGQDGAPGQDGQDGAPGQDGQDGEDGITPQLKIENEYWYVSYDNGKTWVELGKATTDSDSTTGGESLFQGIDTTDDSFVIFTLSDGTQIKVPTWAAFEELVERCNQMNTNIESLQQLINALQTGDYITSVTPLTENGAVVGYTITFAKSPAIVIYHGKDGADGAPGADGEDGQDGQDGADGHTPQISVRQDTDGNWYWVVDGEWLLDESGNKVRANGRDGAPGQDGEDGAPGQDGQDGEDGAPGQDGQDGITPQLKIENGRWMLSIDNGKTWTDIGQATGDPGEDGQDGAPGEDGQDGADGDSFFASVTEGEHEVTFVLSDGTQFTLPKSSGIDIVFENTEEIRFSLGSSYRINYTLVNSDASTSIQLVAQDGLKARLEPADETTGAIVVQTPMTIVERSTVIVLVSDGRGKVVMKALNFVYDGLGQIGQGILIITTAEPFEVGAAGGTVEVPVQTNLSYRVEVSEAAAGWLQYVQTRSLRNETVVLTAAANTGAQRRGFVYFYNLEDESLVQTVCITQEGDNAALAETISFVDPNFEKMVVTNFDLDGDGKLSKAEALHIESLSLSTTSVSDLTGIEWFTNLRVLDCSDQQIKTLDLSHNTALEELECYWNYGVTELDLSKNEALRILNCANTSISRLDLSHNRALTSLSCGGTPITSLDLSNHSEIVEVYCVGGGSLRQINLSGCSKLVTLSCPEQELTSLNLSDCAELRVLNVRDNQLSSLDLSHNPKLTDLDCAINRISSFNLSYNAQLTSCNIDNNAPVSLNLGTIPLKEFSFTTRYDVPSSLKITAPVLESLEVGQSSNYSDLQHLDLSQCGNLVTLELGRGRTGEYSPALTEIDLSVLPRLKNLYISSENELTSLDLSANPELERLSLVLVDISELDLSANTKLASIFIGSCAKLESLDLSKLTSLSTLDLDRNSGLRYLNLGDNPYITAVELSAYSGGDHYSDFKIVGSKLKTLSTGYTANLDVTECPALTKLSFIATSMKTIDLSGNPLLTDLNVNGGTLETLDLSHNPALTTLNCQNNRLASLNVTQCPALETLYCYENYLKTLDCSGNPAITLLDCSPMETLETLYLNADQRIRYITYERSTTYIPEQTVIEIR